jgi:predicted NBD/HSP70 family sugar kinase
MKRIDLKKVNVARSNTIRDINRQIVLNYVRELGPISRADIARETNLQRSTISLIVGELQRLGLIEEVFGLSSGGRPPALLTLPRAQPIAIGVDLGTVKTTVATCDLTGRVIEREEFLTDTSAEKTTRSIIDCARKLIGKNGSSIEGIGLSIPALVDAKKGLIRYTPHFSWRDPKIIENIRDTIGLPVKADNDANAAALAELWFGRPEIQDVRDFILVFIENGIGTGIVFDGQIYRCKGGVAGEFGHMRIGTDAPVECATGSRECWEAFASERAALARYSTLSRQKNGGDVKDFSGLLRLAEMKDKAALEALNETAHYIGIGLGNLLQGLSPEAIIIGGTIVKAWDLVIDEIRSAAEGIVCQGIPATRIIPSTLGSDPALKGAFSLVLADKFASISI